MRHRPRLGSANGHDPGSGGCRFVGVGVPPMWAAQTDEDRRNELNAEVLGVVRSLKRRSDVASP